MFRQEFAYLEAEVAEILSGAEASGENYRRHVGRGLEGVDRLDGLPGDPRALLDD